MAGLRFIEARLGEDDRGWTPDDDELASWPDFPEYGVDPPYWEGVSPGNAYARYEIMRAGLWERFGGTRWWDPAWRRMPRDEFHQAVRVYEGLCALLMDPRDRRGGGDGPSIGGLLRHVGGRLLVNYEDVVAGPRRGLWDP